MKIWFLIPLSLVTLTAAECRHSEPTKPTPDYDASPDPRDVFPSDDEYGAGKKPDAGVPAAKP